MRKHISPALVISCVALFVSLGGGAYALKVTGKSIKDGSITSADIANKSLRAEDFRPGVLPAFHFTLDHKTVAVGGSSIVGAQKGFSFRLECSREQGDSWEGNGLEVVLKLYGTGATGEKQLVFMPAYPSNDVNRANNLSPQRTRLTFTQDFKVVGEEADAQGEASLSVDADAATCTLNSGVVKIR
ncbi:MAG TPA: hypothetical protein VE972_04915 [Conexibacter sp.]|nr:hypothetical protein [Conexibacter sp.]